MSGITTASPILFFYARRWDQIRRFSSGGYCRKRPQKSPKHPASQFTPPMCGVAMIFAGRLDQKGQAVPAKIHQGLRQLVAGF